MKVIIKKSGEVKNVSLGYAVNYLLPKKLAEIATSKRLEIMKQSQVAAAAQKEEKVGDEHQQAERLDGKVITFRKNSGKSGKINGSITKKDIAMTLKINKTNIILSEPIKKTGEYEVGLKFGASRAKVKVKVLAL